MNTQGQKTGGRQKGTPNKTTASTREFLQQILDGNRELINENFRKLEPYQMMTIVAKILPYITPKMAPKTEKDEHDIALQQMNSFLQLAKMVDKWEEQEEEQNEQNEQNELAEQETKQDEAELQADYQSSIQKPKPSTDPTKPSAIDIKPSTLDHKPNLNSSTLENTDTHTEVRKEDEETTKMHKLQVYHKYAPLVDETTQAEMAYYLMKVYRVPPHELLINGRFPQFPSTLDNTTQTSEAGDAPCPTQSASETQILNPSTLDNVAQVSRVSEDSDTVQSEEQKPTLAKTNLRPYKQQQHRPFYAAIANKRGKQ